MITPFFVSKIAQFTQNKNKIADFTSQLDQAMRYKQGNIQKQRLNTDTFTLFPASIG